MNLIKDQYVINLMCKYISKFHLIDSRHELSNSVNEHYRKCVLAIMYMCVYIYISYNAICTLKIVQFNACMYTSRSSLHFD